MTKYAQYNSIQELECKKRKKKAQSMCNLSFSVLKICPDHPGLTCHQFRLGCLSHCSFFGFTLLIVFFSFSLSFDGHFFLLCFIFALIFSLWKSVVLGTALTASGCLVLDFILKLPFIFLIFFPVNLEAKTDGTAENGTRWVGHPPAAEKRKGIKHLRFPLKRQNTLKHTKTTSNYRTNIEIFLTILRRAVRKSSRRFLLRWNKINSSNPLPFWNCHDIYLKAKCQ